MVKKAEEVGKQIRVHPNSLSPVDGMKGRGLKAHDSLEMQNEKSSRNKEERFSKELLANLNQLGLETAFYIVRYLQGTIRAAVDNMHEMSLCSQSAAGTQFLSVVYLSNSFFS